MLPGLTALKILGFSDSIPGVSAGGSEPLGLLVWGGVLLVLSVALRRAVFRRASVVRAPSFRSALFKRVSSPFTRPAEG